jgi:hypothetical protein
MLYGVKGGEAKIGMGFRGPGLGTCNRIVARDKESVW